MQVGDHKCTWEVPMCYYDKVMEKLKGSEHRAEERVALWQAVSESYEEEGTDGIVTCLSGRMDKIGSEFDALLRELNAQL